MRRLSLLVTLAALSLPAPSPGAATRAEVKLPSVLGSGMVLQRGMAVPIWGWAGAGDQVTVKFAGQTATATAGADGRWQVTLEPLEASAKGRTLTIAGPDNRIELQDVLVGEVWICSGQSNMEWRLNQILNAKDEVAAADHPRLRLFNVPGHHVATRPQDNCGGDWQACTPASASGFSAVGYFFGRRLHRELKVPVGLIGTNWGGTRIEPWTTAAGFRSVPELDKLADEVENRPVDAKVGGGTPGAICNAMVYPLAPFAARGAIWYQGESNGNEGESYYHKKKALVQGWRELFNPDLAFYWVQLANFRAANDDPEGGNGWSELREAQCKALQIPHTGMAVIIDIGEAKDIHPRNKQDVGWRLAQWALHQTYGKKSLVPSGPLYASHAVEGGAIRVKFDHVGKGLMVGEKKGLEPVHKAHGGKLRRFAIAGADRKWHWAEAKIDGDSVVVSSPEVAAPVAVRYAFSMNPEGANLYNADGLPASPFRTDDWPVKK